METCKDEDREWLGPKQQWNDGHFTHLDFMIRDFLFYFIVFIFWCTVSIDRSRSIATKSIDIYIL